MSGCLRSIFLCGILGHEETNCPKRYMEGFVEPADCFPYCQWLRATSDAREGQVTTPKYPRPGPTLYNPVIPLSSARGRGALICSRSVLMGRAGLVRRRMLTRIRCRGW